MKKFALLFTALFIAVTMGSCDNAGQNEKTEYDVYALLQSYRTFDTDFFYCDIKFYHNGDLTVIG